MTKCIINKYLHSTTLSQCKLKPFRSHFWSGLLNVRDSFFMFCRKLLGNWGIELNFGWIFGQAIVHYVADSLDYNLVLNKNIIGAKVVRNNWSCFGFRRNLQGQLAEMWRELQVLFGDLVFSEKTSQM